MEAASVNETQMTLCVWLVGRKAAARAALAAQRRAPAAGMSLSAYVFGGGRYVEHCNLEWQRRIG